jgi:hypothetical protein
LKQEFYFKNDIEKVIFIGFDNKSQKQRKKKSETILNTDSNPDFPTKPFLILCLVLLSTIVVYFTWKTATYKTSFSN